MLQTTDLAYTPAVDLARAIRERELSPVELTEALLARIEAVNPRVNAFCTVVAEGARAAAREAERAVERGEALGPLHGLPVAFKDLTPTAGIRTTSGSPIFADHVPTEDALIVERLRRAGATEAVQPEFEAGLEVIRHALHRYGIPSAELVNVIARRRAEFYRPVG